MYKILFFIVLLNITLLPQYIYDEEAIKKELKETVLLQLNEETLPAYKKMFWASALLLQNSEEVKNAISTVLSRFDTTADKIRRDALEAVYTLFPSGFEELVHQNMKYTSSPKQFAMCAEYLFRAKKADISDIIKLLADKFADASANPILQRLKQRLTDTTGIPNLADLFHGEFIKGKPVIFSLQRKDRNYPGRVIVRLANGRFAASGKKLFSLPQLARALSNLPGYLTNGNTPEGIFSFSEYARSENTFIGTTPNIQMRLPFETTPADYFKGTAVTEFTEEAYKSLLPDGWKNYPPIMEAFLAGKAGRNEIIAHGTTVNSNYYENQPYYPHTPTHGCLCMFEKWNTTAKPDYSDQEKLMNLLTTAGITEGFVVVVNISDEQKAVTEQEVNKFIEKYNLQTESVAD